MQAIAASSSTAAPASRLLLILVDTMRKEEGQGVARRLWLDPLAKALLTGPDQYSRSQVADYLLGSLGMGDPGALIELLRELRRIGGSEGDVALWALVVVAEKARALGLPGTELVEERYEEPMVTLAEARRACLSGEDDLRTAALRLLIASNKTTTPLCPEEQALLEEVRSWS